MTIPEPCDHPPLYEQDGICWLCEEFFGQTNFLEILENQEIQQ